MERIRPVTPTEVEQMREEIFKDKESESITYEEDESEEEELQHMPTTLKNTCIGITN